MNRSQRIARASILSGLLIVAAVTWLSAGNLNPPAGPVTPTMKTLAEVEPRIAVNATNTPGDADSLFKITLPGSYYLTGNITGLAGRSGIEIAASGVSINLMGFQMTGVAGSLSGIVTSVGAYHNLTVRNGVVTGWGGAGIDISGGNGSLLEALHASNNFSYGLRSNSSGVIRGCTAISNGLNGIHGPDNLVVENCTVQLNAGHGIATAGGIGTLIRGCTSRQNTLSGISAGQGATVLDCSAHDNGDKGINTSIACTISRCTVSSNTGDGISVLGASTVSHCTAVSNTGDGISAQEGTTISHCTAGGNTGDGIQVGLDCLVSSNTCDHNGFGAGDGAGIHVIASDNRIEGNNCTDADRGIDIDNGANFVIRNTCAANTTNWDVVAGNVCLVVAATGSPTPITGNFGGTAPGSTDPNANFTY